MYKLFGLAIGASAIAIFASKAMLDTKNAPTPPVAGARQSAAAALDQAQAVSLAADGNGHFVADVKINGMFIKGLVDTGATSVAIPLEVARSIGIDPPRAEYNVRIQTANGETLGARVRLNEVRISSIVVRDVEGVVVEKGLSTTLVGMSFIRRISSEMRGTTLTLRQ